MTNTENQQRNDDQIDLSALLGTLIDHRWLIISITALFALVSSAYAVFGTPVYQANAVVQVEQKVPDLPGLSAISQTLGASSSEATTEIALIESRMVIGQAVKNLRLNTTIIPDRFPIFGGYIARHYLAANDGDVASPRFGLNRYDWGGSQLDIFQLKVPDLLLGKPLTLVAGSNGKFTLSDADGGLLLHGSQGQSATGHGVEIQVKELRANAGTRFQVIQDRELATISQLQKDIDATEQGKDSGIIALTYENIDPGLAAGVLNEISNQYVRQNVERNSAQAANSLQFVKEQLPTVRHQLDAAQDALSAYQTQAHSVDVSLQTKALLDQAVAVDTTIQQLHMQMAEADRLYTREHPAYKAIAQQIGQLESKKASLEKQVGTLPDTQQALLKLTRDVEVTNATYTQLLNQAQQLDIARAGTIGNVRVVDQAAVDITQPTKPKKLFVIAGGIFLGAFFAIAIVFLRQLLNKGVEDPAAIEQLGLPVYASIPLSREEQDSSFRGPAKRRVASKRPQHHLLAVASPADLATEALRSLRTSLHFARLEAKNNLLMISGSSPAAGKTFISGNLAAVIAQGGQKVLLIDADMRKGALHKVIGGGPERGLSELISGQIDLKEATRMVEGLENLHFIARGKVPPNPSELLMHSSFTDLLSKIGPLYDLVIIDTPPVLAVTDAAIIGHHAGTRLLVVRFGLNQLREIALAKHRLEQSGVELKGAIFNAVEKRSTGYYSYGYYEYKAKSE